jgi:hypothetical protein
MITALITLADIVAVEEITANAQPKKVNTAISDAQDLDVRPLIGKEFWIAIEANPVAYPDLMGPKTYTHNGHDYQSPGLKHVIALYAFSRYLSRNNQHSTPYGTMYKENPHSSVVSPQETAREVKMATSKAEAYWKDVEDYLDRNRSAYPLWRFGCGSGTELTGNGVRIRSTNNENTTTKCCNRRGSY